MIMGIERIFREASDAVERRIRFNVEYTNGEPKSAFTGDEVRQLRNAQDAHHRQLRSLRAAVETKNNHSIQKARLRLMTGFAPRLMAVVRAAYKIRKSIAFTTFESWAHDLRLDKTYQETAVIRPVSSTPTSWRPVCTSGVRRRAQQLLVRDLLLMQIGDNPYDSTVPGAGGETRLFSDMKIAIEDGFYFWASLDIRNFFPSLRPGHLAGFPLSEWIVKNVVFLPPEAPIRFIDPRCGIDLTEEAIFNDDEDDQPVCPSYTVGLVRSKVKQVRQGLIQGDVCAPQIARTVLGRELQRVLEKWDVVYGSHLDDIVIGARSRSELKASIKALTYRLNSLPAGPLDLHQHEIRDVRDSVYFLGYRISQRKDGSIYVRPGMERFDRFRERLRNRLDHSTATTKAGLLDEALAYAKEWFRAHPAWDQAPHSDGPHSGASWDYVWSEATVCMNHLIYDEWIAGAEPPWTEEDIDFDLIAY